MEFPSWLDELRRAQIIDVVRDDMRTVGESLLGVRTERIFGGVIGGGQADFDAPWERLSPDERALLYAYFIQKGHIEELMEAFTLLFDDSSIHEPVVVDLGCGPFTGGLALAAVLGGNAGFTYIGMDRAASMRRLGERLAAAAECNGAIPNVTRHWVDNLDSLQWSSPPGWSPVIVVVSYLLASSSLNPSELVAQTQTLLERLGRGPVTVLYTNSVKEDPNRSFPAFRDALNHNGFTLIADENGRIRVDRWGGPQERELRYALFHRRARTALELGGG